MTRDQACLIIDYVETLEEYCNHQRIISQMQEKGTNETELDKACQALGKLAGRTFRIL